MISENIRENISLADGARREQGGNRLENDMWNQIRESLWADGTTRWERIEKVGQRRRNPGWASVWIMSRWDQVGKRDKFG